MSVYVLSAELPNIHISRHALTFVLAVDERSLFKPVASSTAATAERDGDRKAVPGTSTSTSAEGQEEERNTDEQEEPDPNLSGISKLTDSLDETVEDTRETPETSTPKPKKATVVKKEKTDEPKIYYCETGNCKKKFSSVHGLKVHMTGSHNVLITHTCNLCHEVFDTVKEKTKHDATHHKMNTRSSSPKLHFCRFEGCTHSSNRPFDIKRHETSCRFNPVNIFTCKKCSKPKSYRDEKSLIEHYTGFHKAKPANHLCQACHTMTISQEAMDMHKKNTGH